MKLELNFGDNIEKEGINCPDNVYVADLNGKITGEAKIIKEKDKYFAEISMPGSDHIKFFEESLECGVSGIATISNSRVITQFTLKSVNIQLKLSSKEREANRRRNRDKAKLEMAQKYRPLLLTYNKMTSIVRLEEFKPMCEELKDRGIYSEKTANIDIIRFIHKLVK